jgi:hypothetical protein
MRLLQYLNEIYATTVKPGWSKKTSSADVFTNPTSKELRSIVSGNCRIIVDKKNKKIYVWDAEEVIHYDVAKALNIGSFDDQNMYIYYDAYVKNGKLDRFTYYLHKNEKPEEYDWLKPYFNKVELKSIRASLV